MSDFTVVRPRDDADAVQASDWCDDLCSRLLGNGHHKIADVDDLTPADTVSIIAALGKSANLVCYFGHGDENAWLTNGSVTIDATNIRVAIGKAIVSVACKTGCNLAPNAITAGVISWLGFTINVPILAPHKNRDPFGEAIVGGLACLSIGGTMQQARDDIAVNCDQLVIDFDTGTLSNHPAHFTGYYAAMSLRDHTVLHGVTGHQPLP